MSMVINLVEDHNIYLCEGGPVYNGGVSPTPITYLTQWKIVGNSEVHGVGNLTSWKVFGNSIVQDGVIMSCGDLGQDGKYHVKISNGVTIYDIPLDEPLRKVDSVADSIEFPSGTEGKALVTRNISATGIDNEIKAVLNNNSQYRWLLKANAKISKNNMSANVLSNKYSTITANETWLGSLSGVAIDASGKLLLFDSDYTESTDKETLIATNANTIILYELATPTTELIDVSPFPVSATDTYSSANVTPYSAFEHTENKEIWSCGEYNATDGKYHILVQPLGGSIADIALDEPLRKVNDVADTIEFPSNAEGKALVTRNLACVKNLGGYNWFVSPNSSGVENYICRMLCSELSTAPKIVGNAPAVALCAIYTTDSADYIVNRGKYGIAISSRYVTIRDANYGQQDSASALKQHLQGIEFIYWIEPTTELVDAPQIEEAESYTCVISQGGKAVEWSSFSTS